MAPVEFLTRLAALIPPPKFPLVRYHGVLAPNSKWREDVVTRLSAEQRAELRQQEGRVHRKPEARAPPVGRETTCAGTAKSTRRREHCRDARAEHTRGNIIASICGQRPGPKTARTPRKAPTRPGACEWGVTPASRYLR